MNGTVRIVCFAALWAFGSAAPAQEIRTLTKDGRQCFDPVYVVGGREIVFSLLETPIQTSLMKLTVDDGKVARLHPQATTNEFEPTLTPDGRWLAFVQSRGNLNLKMMIRDLSANKEATFNPGEGFAGVRRPSLLPDGSRIFFAIPGNNGIQIASCDNQGKDRKDVTNSGINQGPAVSPDGKRIAFSSSRDGDVEIYAMDIDGANAVRLTKSPGMDIRPAWSPDGKRIAFVSNRDANYEIYVMDRDGSNVRRLTRNEERDDYPSWHPDGRSLVFVAERQGRFDLATIPVP